MATVTAVCCIHQIGETAGQIWHTLDEGGPISLAKLTKRIEAPRDVTMQAVGWLAHEEKIDIEETRRGRVVSLR